MKRYLVSLHGQNLLIEMKGEEQKYGFRTKRYVQARNEEEAERKALRLILNDGHLQANIRNRDADPPMVTAEEIEEVEKPVEQDYKDIKMNYYKEEAN